jgi:dipeptidyl aminopeptidase/acylaminoacyl peptidase
MDMSSGDERALSPEGGTVATWAFTPAGDAILYAGDIEPTGQTDFFLVSISGGAARRLTDDLPCLPDAGFPPVLPGARPAWLDERTAVFHAFHHGRSGTWTIDIVSGEVRQLEGADELRTGFSTDAGAQVAAQASASLESVGELEVVDLRHGASQRISAYSAAVLAESAPARWERIDVPRGRYTIEAWLLTPPGFDPSLRYPLVIDIHGGPQGYYGYGFNAVQQALATHGIPVIYANPRGSSTYGREFTQQVIGDWGGEDYLDLMAVVDAALERGTFDPSRLGIWGYSYGGYMTAWTIARNHRFKAAVCGAPCFDLESMYGTSDISHIFGPMNWNGAPHEAREWYATHSPSQYAHNTRTPTLIIQGEADERCPVGQGEQMFVTLKKAGCEVEFARYPGGSHLFMRMGPAAQRLDVVERILAWFKRHLEVD